MNQGGVESTTASDESSVTAAAAVPFGSETIQAEPPVPYHLGASLEVSLRTELHRTLWHASGQLGTVYRAIVAHPGAGPTELFPYTDCANAGVVANRRIIVESVMQGVEPKSPSVARQAARTVGSLLRHSTNEEAKGHLSQVLAMLELKAGDPEAVEAETKQLEVDAANLEEALKQAAGVYVYTFPHYWKHPYDADSERRLFKVGRTTNQAWTRVLNQARTTGMPEDPLLLRVYETADPSGTEKSFHMLLDAAQHQRSTGTAVGKEWFVSTLEFCDTVATVLGLKVHRGETETSI